ncbi:MAG: transcriptional regulator [Streptosporangiales bacterium]|nr:transcriptional regulator [Streptosporangiales bacterium]
MRLAELDIGLERDVFLGALIRELAESLEEIVGMEEASSYISLVGQRLGERIDGLYAKALELDGRLDRHQIAAVLIDLKRRIQGDFFIIEESEDRIVLGNRACPFGDKVLGRESMCMLTSNLFGQITAQHLGYAKVELRETIARGAPGCRVVIHLRGTPEAVAADGRDYFGEAVAPGPAEPGDGSASP